MHILTGCLFIWEILAFVNVVKGYREERPVLALGALIVFIALIPIIAKYLVLTGMKF